MSDHRPQNPVFPVDPNALAAFAPKVVCTTCGTIIAVRARRGSHKVLCPACGTRLAVRESGDGYSASPDLTIPTTARLD